MAGYSFTAMHQFSCGSSQGPSDPHCLFACHIQPAWPFCCLSVHIYKYIYIYVSHPLSGCLTPYLVSCTEGGSGMMGERSKGETPTASHQLSIQTSPLSSGSTAPCFSLSSWLSGMTGEDHTPPGESISSLGFGVTHSWLTSGWRNCYVKSKQFLSGRWTACGSRSKARCGGVITAVETTFWHLSLMKTLKQSYSAQVLLRISEWGAWWEQSKRREGDCCDMTHL